MQYIWPFKNKQNSEHLVLMEFVIKIHEIVWLIPTKFETNLGPHGYLTFNLKWWENTGKYSSTCNTYTLAENWYKGGPIVWTYQNKLFINTAGAHWCLIWVGVSAVVQVHDGECLWSSWGEGVLALAKAYPWPCFITRSELSVAVITDPNAVITSGEWTMPTLCTHNTIVR